PSRGLSWARVTTFSGVVLPRRMSEAGHRVLPHEPRAFGKPADASATGADTMRAGAPSTGASRGGPADPDAMARLATSMVPPPPPAWRRLLSQVQHFWLLVAFIIVWQCISVFGLRFNPHLRV